MNEETQCTQLISRLACTAPSFMYRGHSCILTTEKEEEEIYVHRQQAKKKKTELYGSTIVCNGICGTHFDVFSASDDDDSNSRQTDTVANCRLPTMANEWPLNE